MLFNEIETRKRSIFEGGKKSKEFCLGLVMFEMSMSNSRGNTEEAIQCGAQVRG